MSSWNRRAAGGRICSMRRRRAGSVAMVPPSIRMRRGAPRPPYSIQRQSPSWAGSISMANMGSVPDQLPVSVAVSRETENHGDAVGEGGAANSQHDVAESLPVLHGGHLLEEHLGDIDGFRAVDQVAGGDDD